MQTIFIESVAKHQWSYLQCSNKTSILGASPTEQTRKGF